MPRTRVSPAIGSALQALQQTRDVCRSQPFTASQSPASRTKYFHAPVHCCRYRWLHPHFAEFHTGWLLFHPLRLTQPPIQCGQCDPFALTERPPSQTAAPKLLHHLQPLCRPCLLLSSRTMLI